MESMEVRGATIESWAVAMVIITPIPFLHLSPFFFFLSLFVVRAETESRRKHGSGQNNDFQCIGVRRHCRTFFFFFSSFPSPLLFFEMEACAE